MARAGGGQSRLRRARVAARAGAPPPGAAPAPGPAATKPAPPQQAPQQILFERPRPNPRTNRRFPTTTTTTTSTSTPTRSSPSSPSRRSPPRTRAGRRDESSHRSSCVPEGSRRSGCRRRFLRSGCASPLPAADDPFIAARKAKEAAAESFRSLLRERGVDGRARWDRWHSKLAGDPRFQQVATHSERRSTFEKYVRPSRTREKAAKRAGKGGIRRGRGRPRPAPPAARTGRSPPERTGERGATRTRTWRLFAKGARGKNA